MAGAATATYSADVWTSPGSVDASQQPWDFSVPARQNSNARPKSRSRDSGHRRSRDKGSRSSSLSRHAYSQEANFLALRGRREHSPKRHESEPGFPRDLHGYEAANRAGSKARDSEHNGPHKGSDKKDGMGQQLNELDSAHWIHRDKLARIESEELQQAAYLFHRRAGLENGKPSRARNHDSNNSGFSGFSGSVGAPMASESMEPWPNLRDEQRNHTSSPTPFDGDGTGDVTEEERRGWDLRRPEEIAADEVTDSASSMYRNPGLRKSSSRIPISTASPAPISPEHLGREFPMQRARTLTNGEEEILLFGKPRRASEPIAVEASDSSATPSATPSAGSRPNSRGIQPNQNSPAKRGPTSKGSATRKTSAPPSNTRKSSRNRTVSTNSQRPTTRSGEPRPPQPINRPEGDPPWLATMYKPDPRLPPDQQILPTHARRMLQEQWEKEGRTPTTYDREFAPLAIGPDDRPQLSSKEEDTEKVENTPDKAEEQSLSPVQAEKTDNLLASPKSPASRPSSSTGYSPMPKLQEMPAAAQVGLTPKWNPPVVTAQPPPPKEKGCGCCIIM
ncbi:uncharacterized protein P174DRAFT_421199 [Aspergillus novofumigatus IBT 16806]|uniref:TeaA receptor TeaR n=1 Tax=Aspergillus novofumigatus (strain IBT 16806) TaxID=1392255 RepID=A0A2I1CAK5_ASPN1|nr:uncharacterized protein P174DRAFT_421199 [Aspergillus novofumigatus IBT 16806]PKX94665.1 hypothetical protein P174DRAFT_421199 [Aspergillus novofumigatus IBT 16806]